MSHIPLVQNMDVPEVLDAAFGSKNFQSNIALLCRHAEEFLLKLVRNRLLVHFRLTANKENVRFRQIRETGFIYNGQTFFISLRDGGHSKLVLEILSTEPSYTSQEIIKARSKITSSGQFTAITLYVHKRLQHCVDDLISIACEILCSGYRWLEYHILDTVVGMGKTAARKLYFHLRSRLPETLTDYVWFYVITGDKVLFVPDYRGLTIALSRTKSSKVVTPYSAIELFTDFATHTLDFEISTSKRALGSKRTVVLNLDEAAYVHTGIQVAEKVVYKTSRTVVQPIIQEGNDLLTVGYPAEMLRKLEEFFDTEKEKFRDIMQQEHKSFWNLRTQLTQQHTLPDIAGKFAWIGGQFIRGLFDIPSVRGS